ncbi:TRAP transporter small permease [Halorussus halobius]|uniref:TRAP transporter small permease n=1 Tax=Halorussus halobius TaxID=1710537 RepID=UPI0010932936|nr:TRAP transporter small permease [Halorussus halobius]
MSENTDSTGSVDSGSDGTVLDGVHKGLEVVGVALLVLIGVITSARVVARTSPAFPNLIWSGEIARYALVIMTIIGIPYAMRTEDHISIRPLLEGLEERTRTVLFLTANVLVVGFSFLLAYASARVAERTLGNPLPTVRWLNYGYVNILITIMFVLTAIYALEQVASEWRTLTGNATTDGESVEAKDNA